MQINFISSISLQIICSSNRKSGGMEFISQTHIPCIDGDVGGIFDAAGWFYV